MAAPIEGPYAMASPPPASLHKVSPRVKVRNIFAIASGKGGVGKTWFSITLAHALTIAGRKSLLFDGDLGLANLDIQLGLMPKYDLGAVISGRMTLGQAVTAFGEGGFDVIAGRSGSGSLANLAASRVQMLCDDLAQLAGAYDAVVLDLGAGVDRTVRQLAHSSATCLVLATDEPTSLTDAYAFIKMIHAERPGGDIRIIVNVANSTKEGEKTYRTLLKACEGFLKISPPLLGIVRRDAKVREAIRSQKSLLTRYPNSEAALDVEAIARRLLG